MKRVPLNGNYRTISETDEWYQDVVDAITVSKRDILVALSNNQPIPDKYFGYTIKGIYEEFDNLLKEHERIGILQFVSSAEACFRIDFYKRVYQKRKDSVSRAFRRIYQNKGDKVRLREDILKAWDSNGLHGKGLSDFYRLLDFRHWMAHGRYWTLKVGIEPDYTGTFLTIENLLNKLPDDFEK